MDNVLGDDLVTLSITAVVMAYKLIINRYKADSPFMEAKEDENEILISGQLYFTNR
jgi:hypothetical protein